MGLLNTHRGTELNWSADKNSDNPYTITCRENVANGPLFNLTPYVFTLEIFSDWGTTAVKTLTEGSGLTNGGAAGTIAIDLTLALASIKLSRPEYKYRIKYVVNGKTFTMFYGTLSLSPESASSPPSTSISATININGSEISAAITLAGSMTGSQILTALGVKTANTLLAGPSSGASAVPAFRALVGADLPANFVISATAPATTLVWLDSASIANQAYPIRRFINGAWTPVTDEGDWWDTIGEVISKGKPIAILFSGQSNAGGPAWFPVGEPTYTGDITISKHVSLFQPATDVFKVFNNSDPATRGNRTWTFPSGGGTAQSTDDVWTFRGTNAVWLFAKLYAKEFNRSVRVVGISRGGQPLAQWEAGKLAWIELTTEATASGIQKFDAFIWIHGEAGLNNVDNPSTFTTYRDSFYDFVARLKAQSWADEKLKVIATSNALNTAQLSGHSQTILSPNGDVDHEGTVRSLDNQDNPYYGWAAAFFAREAQDGGSDTFHFTTREHERLGAAIFRTYLSLPNYKKGDRLFRTFYTNTSNRLTSAVAVLPNTNSFEFIWSGGNSTTAQFIRSFSATGGVGYLPDIKEIVKGIGANFMSWEIQSDNGVPGTLEMKLKVDTNGVTAKLLNLPFQNTIGSAIVGGIVFSNVGGASPNNMWIARDGANQHAITYKAGQSGFFEGAHKFYLGDTFIGQFYWRSNDFNLLTFDLAADLRITSLGKGLYIKEGTNATMGVATLVAGTVTVSNTKVTANSRIFLTIQSLGTVTTPKAIGITARVAGTSFTITSADATDTSVIAWHIIEGF